MTNPTKLCFIVSEDWYFCSHRLPLAEEGIRRGWEVALISRVSDHGERLRAMGVRLIHVDIDRGGVNPLNEFRYGWRLLRALRKERPNLIHNVAVKPCLYGSLAAIFIRGSRVVNAVAGLGSAVTSPSKKIRLVRPFVKGLLGWLFCRKDAKLILQNGDDVREFQEVLHVPRERIHLIKGSGVDLDEFHPPERRASNETPLIVMVSRLLIEKGVRELIEAARLLKERTLRFRVVLVGDVDAANSHSVPEEEIEKAVGDRIIEAWGRRSDVPDIYRQADIATLPSYYREGLPKTLIEAAASGLPIVTTDSVGCRETVKQGENGFLVPPKNPAALADALEILIRNADLRQNMGRKSRELAETEFDVRRVVDMTFRIYDELLER